MKNKDENDKLEDTKFIAFLDKITAFIWSYALTNPGVNSLRTPVFAAMVNIVEDKDVTFEDFLVDENASAQFSQTTFFQTSAL